LTLFFFAVRFLVVLTGLPALGLSVPLLDAPGCPEQYGVQTYHHPEACDQFFLCTNGTLTLETCENGLLYDGKGAVHNHCNYHWAVECGPRKAVRTYKASLLFYYEYIHTNINFSTAVVGFKCPDKVDPNSISAKFHPYPRYAIPGDCDHLVTCVDGFPRLIACGEGKVLDENTLTCEEPEHVPSW
ncbi:uncharacterized protein, partial [Halyomorpha halys]|uniref:uncharacterized protein n=1 Tax=Halyomorpha halys TaxID=286706 RepID=UPI0034D29EEB